MPFTRGPVAYGDTYATTVNTLDTSPSFNLAAGKLVVVSTMWEGVSGTASVSDTAGNTYTAGTKVQVDGSSKWVKMFYCLSSASNASNVVTADLPDGCNYAKVCATVYNPSGSASFVAEGTGAGTSAAPATASFTAGDCAVCAMGEYAGQTGTAGTGWTNVVDDSSNASHIEDRIDSPGGTITGSYSIAGANWGIVAMSFADGGGGGGANNQLAWITA